MSAGRQRVSRRAEADLQSSTVSALRVTLRDTRLFPPLLSLVRIFVSFSLRSSRQLKVCLDYELADHLLLTSRPRHLTEREEINKQWQRSSRTAPTGEKILLRSYRHKG